MSEAVVNEAVPTRLCKMVAAVLEIEEKGIEEDAYFYENLSSDSLDKVAIAIRTEMELSVSLNLWRMGPGTERDSGSPASFRRIAQRHADG
ncbi:hypothetical protein ACWCQZ_48685 [Streptomyces sp. NPDC002285]